MHTIKVEAPKIEIQKLFKILWDYGVIDIINYNECTTWLNNPYNRHLLKINKYLSIKYIRDDDTYIVYYMSSRPQEQIENIICGIKRGINEYNYN